MKSTRRACMILLAVSLCFTLLWAGCGGGDDNLKIIIEDTTGGAAPDPNTAGPSPVPEPGTAPGPGIPLGPGDVAPSPAPPTGNAREMNMDVLEVVSLVVSSPEFEEDVMLKAIPKMVVGNRPQNALWGVRLMVKDTIIAEYAIDDNTRTIVMAETYFDRIRDVLKQHDDNELKKHFEDLASPTLGYDDALNVALSSPLFPEPDTSREFWVTIIHARFDKNPAWNVTTGYLDSEEFTHIVIDASGVILEVKNSP